MVVELICVWSQVRRHFKPELLNRLDEIVVFDPLSHDQLRKVARLQLKDVAVRLADRGVALGVTEAALDVILRESYDPVSIKFILIRYCQFTWLFNYMVRLILAKCEIVRCMVRGRSGDGWKGG